MNIRKVMLIFVLSFIVFPIFAKASTCDINSIIIDSITLNKIYGTAEELSPAVIDNNKINIDIKFHDPGDAIEYSFIVKNVSDEGFYFDESSLVNNTDYVEYVFSHDGDSSLIKPGEVRTTKLVVKYKNKVSTDKLTNDSYSENKLVNLNLTDGKNIINPETGLINPLYYVVLLGCSFGLLIISIKHRKVIKYTIILMCVSFTIPLISKALCKCSLPVDSKITIDNKEAYFITGKEFNIRIKQLAGDDTSINAHTTKNTNITKILYSNVEPLDTNKQSINVVSTDSSPYPIYTWYDNGIIYWWSEDKSPQLNPDAAYMFLYLSALNNLEDFKYFDTSKMTTTRSMFYGDTSLLSLDGLENWDLSSTITIQGMFASTKDNPMNLRNIKALKNWDVSNITILDGVFSTNSYLESLEGLEDWNVSNVKSMYLTFSFNFRLKSLKELKKWDVSNVENMEYMFSNTLSLENLEGLEDWNVSNVKSMYAMFKVDSDFTGYISPHLKDISALSLWNTESLEKFGLFLYLQTSLDNLSPLDNFSTSKVSNYEYTFYKMLSLKELDMSNFDFSNVTSSNNARIINNCTNLERLKTPKVYPTDVNVKIKLPVTMYDENGNSYTQLDNTSPTETWLTINP